MDVAHALTFTLQTIAHRIGSIVGPSGLMWACAQVHVRPEASQNHPSAKPTFRVHPSHGHEYTSQRNGCGQGF
jgi:hypothetical protein